MFFDLLVYTNNVQAIYRSRLGTLLCSPVHLGLFYAPWGSCVRPSKACTSPFKGACPPSSMHPPLHVCTSPLPTRARLGALIMPFGALSCPLGVLCAPPLKCACTPSIVCPSPQYICAPKTAVCAPTVAVRAP
jgi:hypothetical protein